MNVTRWGMLSVAILGLAAGLARADHVTLSGATATFSQSGFEVGYAIDGVLNNSKGWAIDPNEVAQSAIFTPASPVGGAEGTVFTFTLSQLFPSPDMHTIGKFKLSVTTDGSSWNDLQNVAFAANPAETPVSIAADGTILLDGSKHPSTSVYTVTGSTNLAAITGFKLDVLEDASLPFQGPGRQPLNGNFVLTEFQVNATPVPLPSAAWGGLVLLGGLAVKRLRRHA